MLDPDNAGALARRVADMSARWSDDATPEDEHEGLRNTILKSIVALFDCRHMGTIDVMLDNDPSVYRYEVTDEAIFLTWYHDPGSVGREFAQTFRFGSESYFYNSLRLELLRRFDMAGRKMSFRQEMTDADLARVLNNLFTTKVSVAEIGKWRHEYATEISDFRIHLKSVSGPLAIRK
jgi:hypothetical protein